MLFSRRQMYFINRSIAYLSLGRYPVTCWTFILLRSVPAFISLKPMEWNQIATLLLICLAWTSGPLLSAILESIFAFSSLFVNHNTSSIGFYLDPTSSRLYFASLRRINLISSIHMLCLHQVWNNETAACCRCGGLCGTLRTDGTILKCIVCLHLPTLAKTGQNVLHETTATWPALMPAKRLVSGYKLSFISHVITSRMERWDFTFQIWSAGFHAVINERILNDPRKVSSTPTRTQDQERTSLPRHKSESTRVALGSLPTCSPQSSEAEALPPQLATQPWPPLYGVLSPSKPSREMTWPLHSTLTKGTFQMGFKT